MNLKITFIRLWAISMTCFFLTGAVHATNEVTDFIDKSRTNTFDCPEQTVIDQVEDYLSMGELSVRQLRGLESLKAHHLICLGDYAQAQKLISLVIDSRETDKKSHTFAMAHYQLGFIYDVQQNPRKCEQYQIAENLGKDMFDDIYLSARLGLITECADENKEFGVNLGRLYALLETYANKNDLASVAHIHNNIGLLYNKIGQSALAAEQYEKVYEIGLEVYEPMNQVSPLMSVISAYTGTGDYEKAMLMIGKLEEARVELNTPMVNNWYYYSLTRYFSMMKDMPAMKASLTKWKSHIDQVSSRSLRGLFEWYSATICLHEKNKKCVLEFITQQNNKNTSQFNRVSDNREFLRFLVKANFFIGNMVETEKVFDRYADRLHSKIRSQHTSAKVLGVAQLHNNILLLEADLQAAENRRLLSMIMIVIVILTLLLVAYFSFFRSYLRRLKIDPLSGLLNEQSVMQQITAVRAPIAGKVNALAVFDVANFTDVNSKFGNTEGDMLLKRIAESLQLVIREHDISGRLGSGQFLVCLKNIEESIANELFERIQQSLALITDYSNKVDVRSSMSIYLATDDFSDLKQILVDMLAKH